MSPAPLRAAPPAPGVPEPLAHYAQATLAGGLVFVSGLLPLDAGGQVVGGDDPAAQARAVFAAMAAVLEAAGSGMDQVAKLTIFVLDLADRAAINAERAAAFGAWRPASTLVQVAGLMGAGARLEIEAIAALTPADGAEGP